MICASSELSEGWSCQSVGCAAIGLDSQLVSQSCQSVAGVGQSCQPLGRGGSEPEDSSSMGISDIHRAFREGLERLFYRSVTV